MFAGIQEMAAPQPQAVRKVSRSFAPIRVQFSHKYGLEYGRRRLTESRDHESTAAMPRSGAFEGGDGR